MFKCDACTTVISSSRLFKCADCKIVVYCSKECQRAAWRTHKKPCRAAVSDSRAKTAKNMGAMEVLVGHVKNVNARIERETACREELTKLYNANNFEGVLAMKADALAVVESMGARSELHERSHLEIARVYCIIGTANRCTGRFRESLDMYVEARTAVDRIAGVLNPVKSPVYHTLALGLHSLHRYEEALSINTQVVEMNENGLPGQRMNAYEGMAACLAKEGNYAEAAGWYKAVSGMACNDAQTARALYQFATCQLVVGEHVVAYDIFKDLALDTLKVSLHAHAILSMAHCMWNKIRSAPGGDAEALHAFGVHVGEAAAVLEYAAAAAMPSITARFLVLSAVYQRLVGAQTGARLYVVQLLRLLSVGARNNCWGCGQTRNEDEMLKEYRLKSCEKCRVARFCNLQCQSRFSAGKDCTDVGSAHFVKHRVVCALLRVHRDVPAIQGDAELAYDAALTAGAPEDAAAALPACAWGAKLTELVYRFLDDLTADCARV